MKKTLEQWKGKFRVGNRQVTNDLKDWNPKNGEKFKVVLIKEDKK